VFPLIVVDIDAEEKVCQIVKKGVQSV
jgi:hypothetical protein